MRQVVTGLIITVAILGALFSSAAESRHRSAIYNRVPSVALEVPTNEGTLLGSFMAHEIGHLMLPRDSHTKAGLMKSDWDVRDLGRVDLLKLQFSEQQADQIRSTIESESRFLARTIPR